MNRAVIALGSNIEPQKNIPAARKRLAQIFSLVDESEFIFTEPVGYKNQPKFLNGAILVETSDNQHEIVSILKQIENEFGRQRTGNKNGPRKIDLDLILFNGRVVDDDIFERKFLERSVREVLPHFNLSA